MLRKAISARLAVAAGFVTVISLMWIVGCQSSDSSRGSAGAVGAAPATTQPILAASSGAGASGAQLWSQTCSRCHNLRPPQYYSDAQWELIVHHMRLRANLTEDEQREITKFLQAAN